MQPHESMCKILREHQWLSVLQIFQCSTDFKKEVAESDRLLLLVLFLLSKRENFSTF